MNASYDIIVSLGGNCYAAKQLQHRGMRPFALPLDWTFMSDDHSIRCLPSLITTKFDGFCRYENMREIMSPVKRNDIWTYKFQDYGTMFGFVHHFHASLSDRDAFERSRAVICRRINRFYQKIQCAKSALFVLETSFAFDANLLNDIYAALHETFPEVEIDLYSMQFFAPEPLSVRLADHIELHTYVRSVDYVPDVRATSSEWAWIDELRINGMPKARERRKSNVWIRCKYALWKHLGKSLYRDGAGCIGITVP